MAYFPNSASGEVLESQCCQCPVGRDCEKSACPILFVQTIFNYDQMDKGQDKLREAMTLLVDERGQCQMFALLQPEKQSAEQDFIDRQLGDL